MRKLDIPDMVNISWANAQRIKTQVVKTRFGDILVDCTVRPLRMSAAIREWRVWFERFVSPRLYDPTSSLGLRNLSQYASTIKNWKSKCV